MSVTLSGVSAVTGITCVSALNHLETDDDGPRSDEERASAVERAFMRAKIGLFGVLFVMSKEPSSERMFALFEIVADFLQLLSFPFSEAFPWDSAWTGWLSEATRITRFQWYLEISAGVTDAIFFIALALVIFVLLNATYVGVAFSHGKRMSMPLVRILRTFASLFVTIFFLPLIDIFGARFACHSVDINAGESACEWTGGEAVVKAVAIFTIILLTTLSLCVEATFFDESPISKGVLSRPHARIDVAYLLYKSVISVLDSTLNLHHSGGQWIMVGVLVAGSFGFAYIYTMYPAYYRFGFARLRAVLQWGLAWASISLVVAKISNNREDPIAPVLFFVGIPLAFFAGFLAIGERRRRLLDMDTASISSPYDAELKVRFMLDSVVKHRRLATHADSAGEDEEAASADAHIIAQAEQVYRQALRIIGSPSILLVFQSQFYYSVACNHVLGARALAKASRAAPFHIDEEFFVFRRQQASQEYFSSSANDSKDVIVYMTFMQSVQAARRAEAKCLHAQAAFWTELMHANPDATRLRAISSYISANIALGQQSLHTLLRISPDSPQVCRMYANWLGNVMYDHERKMAYLNRAALYENAQGVEKETTSTQGGALAIFDGVDESGGANSTKRSALNVDSMRDGSSAMLNLSCEEERLGIIDNANTSAVRLFGYVRHDLVGRHVSAMVSPPYSREIESAAQAYVAFGDLRIRGKRNVFLRNKAGYIFPGRLTIKDIPGRGVLPSFVAIAEPIETADHFLLADATSKRIVGCTANCVSLFGVHVEDIHDGKLFLNEIIAEYDQLRGAIGTYAGSEVRIVGAEGSTGAPRGRRTVAWESTMLVGEGSVVVLRIQATIDERNAEEDNVNEQKRALSSPSSPVCEYNGHAVYPSTGAPTASAIPHAAPGARLSGESSHTHAPVVNFNAVAWCDAPQLNQPETDGEDDKYVGIDTVPAHSHSHSIAEKDPPETIELREIRPSLRSTSFAATSSRGSHSMGDSRSSGSRLSTKSRKVNVLRRTLVSANSSGLGGSLKMFRAVVVASVVAVIGVAIAAYVVEKQQVSEFTQSFVVLNAAADIRFHATSGGYYARLIALAQTGLRPTSEVPGFMARLQTVADGLEEGYRIMNARIPKMSPEHRQLFLSQSINYVLNRIGDSSNFTLVLRPSTLPEATKSVIARIRNLMFANLTDFLNSPTYVVPILNGLDGYDYTKAVNRSAAFTMQEVVDQIKGMRSVFAAIAASGLVFVFVLSVCVILPTVIYVERTSDNTLRVFENVPRETIRKMRRKCNKKLRELEAAEDDEEGDDVDGTDDDDDDDDDDDAEVSKVRAARRAALASSSVHKSAVRIQSRRTGRYIAAMALKMGALFILGVLFFSLSYYFGFVRIEDELRDGARRVNYASYIRTTTRVLAWTTREYTSSMTSPAAIAFMDTAAYEAVEILKGLQIGSSVFGLAPQGSLSAQHNALINEDACLWTTDATVLSACRSTSNGILANGLHQAMLWYLEYLRDLKREPASLFNRTIGARVLNDPMFIEARDVEQLYLQPALKRSVDYYNQDIDDLTSTSTQIVLALLIVFIVLVVGAYFAVYERLIVALDAEMKRTRWMMLMLPDDELGQMTEWFDAYVATLSAGRSTMRSTRRRRDVTNV